MNQISFTKNGLPLLICTHLIIIIVICMPLCSTGIIKREIEANNTIEPIWEPSKIVKNESANVTTTTIAPTTITEISSSTAPLTTPRISRRTSTTSKQISIQQTTEKYAQQLSQINVTEASVIDSRPVTNKHNLDDDAEVISFSNEDGVTTEEHRFDLSRYTSDYSGNDNEQSDHNETHQSLTNDSENESDQEEPLSTFNTDYIHNLRDMVLTTPESKYFDRMHKKYENDDSFERYEDDNKITRKESEAVSKKYESDALLNDIHSNSTEERKQSTYLNQAKVESTNYDISASEVRNRTENNSTAPSEKKAKFIQEGSHANLTLPSAAEVWALASMKNIEHTKSEEGQHFNVTTVAKEPEKQNGTLVTKQLADWASVMQSNDFANNTYTQNNYSPNFARIREQLAEAIRNINRKSNRPNRPNNRTSIFNTTMRGKTKYNSNPLITKDQDNASQENQIIAVTMTTLPPPINLQQFGDSFASVTEHVTEGTDLETTTTQTQTMDDRQNELKTQFTFATETETTTDKPLEFTTEIEQKKTSTDVDEILSTTQLYDTSTLEPVDRNVHTTTEKEFPTTNHINLETDSVTELDEDIDHATHEQTSTTLKNLPIATETDQQSQASTLQPQYVDVEKTTEMKNMVQSTTELPETATQFIAGLPGKDVEHIPEVVAENSDQLTTTIINLNRDEYKYSTIQNRLDETTPSPLLVDPMPEVIDDSSQTPATNRQTPDIGEYSLDEPDTNAIIAISVSVVGIAVIGAALGVVYVLRKRKKQLTYGQRCRPVGLDAYSLDNVSVYNSVRRKGQLRQSKRSYGNAAFDDPGLKNNMLTASSLAVFTQKKNEIYEEFKELPTVTARVEEVPAGCEAKNRYANIVPLPETRVFLKRIGDDEKTEYINANYVKGPKDNTNYYIACQGPLDTTVIDFWRMIWERNSRVIIMATDLIENGTEQCSEYLPPSFVIDTHVTFGDFHITLKHREVKDKYAMSMVHLKNTTTNTWREVTHFWYNWPDMGVPTEYLSLIEMLLEARGFLKVTSSEQIDDNENSQSSNGNLAVGNGSVDKSKSLLRTQGPLTVHCSPGTGRTGTIIACDIALRALEQPTRTVDIPQIVYFVRRGRASAVRTREQYEFIYKVANVYAAKLTGIGTEN
ncbi:Tyrosine-protein phosphatase non-receptor type 9 [Pseudolycoriella hygida]|uniref:Tyrosine-protein phosphatase non-receptor type 9 n=1 Tax=Pseudolycoriella hygida TaxID=35572 RepID=A0A9Q0RUK1_9DIPT|nr:Tyrosine-protein phosphatase non-receptor type 9 [Pseudolycoriella hygida]